MKTVLKQFLFKSGLIRTIHHFRNRKSLTVLMLHRVMPHTEITQLGANKEWTISSEVFEQLLKFLSAYYNPINIDDLRQHQNHQTKLPDRALLLTFDDGWRDNYSFAYPLLSKYNFPAHIFACSERIGNTYGFWQEQLHAGVSVKPEIFSQLQECIDSPKPLTNLKALIKYLSDKEPVELAYPLAFEIVRKVVPSDRQMLSETELYELSINNISIGSHGKTHRPLSHICPTEIDGEIDESVEVLSNLTRAPIDTISFPHGSFNSSIVQKCLSKDLKFLFTSMPLIQKTPASLLHRLHVSEKSITNEDKFSPSKTAFHLFFRPYYNTVKPPY